MSGLTTVRVPLRTSFGSKDRSDPSDQFLQKIQQIRQAVAQLRDDNLDLERVRDQYIIHLQQCRDDHNVLRQIFKKLKLKLDLALQEPAAALDAVPVSEGTVAMPASRRLPTLEMIRCAPSVTSHCDTFPVSSVRLRYALTTGSVLCTVQFSPDGSRVAFADGGFVYIVESSDGEVASTIEIASGSDRPQSHTRALKWSRNGKQIALTGSSNDVLLYDAQSRTLLHRYDGHQKDVSSIVFNADGSWLVSGGFDGVIQVWDIRTHELVKRLGHTKNGVDGTIVAVATSPEVPFYAVGFMTGMIGIYSEQFEQPMMAFTAHTTVLMGLSVSAFDDTLGTVSQDKNVKVWTMRGVASCKHTLEGHSDFVLSLAFSPVGPVMITGSKDQTIRMWQHKTGRALCTVSAHRNTLFEIDHHPTQRCFVSCGGDGVVCVWEYNDPG
jgi:WD40 repeat protein